MIAWEGAREARTAPGGSEGPGKPAGAGGSAVARRSAVAHDPATWFLGRVTRRFGEDLSSRILAIWGLPTMKGGAEAAVWNSEVVQGLLARNAKLKVHGTEPSGNGGQNGGQRFHPQVTFSDAHYQCLIGADALLVLVDRNLYRRPDFHRMMVLLQSPVVFDDHALYRPERMAELGFEYHAPSGEGLGDRTERTPVRRLDLPMLPKKFGLWPV